MSQYPINDSTGVYNAVNYLVSSPQSIGQDFNGISEYLPAYLTGNYRLPFTSTTPVTLNVPAINCTAVYQLADNIFRFEFTGAQPVPPFNIGATAIVTTGWANSFYNDYWSPAHIIESTTTSATIQTDHLYPGTGDDLLGGTRRPDRRGRCARHLPRDPHDQDAGGNRPAAPCRSHQRCRAP